MNFGLVKSDQNFGHFGRKWVNILLYCCIFAHTFSLLKGSQFFFISALFAHTASFDGRNNFFLFAHRL